MGGWGGQDGGRREGNQKTLYFRRPPGRLWSFFGATNAKMGALLDPTRFRRDAQMEQFRIKLIQSMRKRDQERFQEKHQNLTDFRCQNRTHEKVKKIVFA